MPRSSLAAAAALGAIILPLVLPRPLWAAPDTSATPAAQTKATEPTVADLQPPDALSSTNRGSLNPSWSPISRLDLVIEYLLGNRVNNDGASGFSNQLQVGGNFRF